MHYFKNKNKRTWNIWRKKTRAGAEWKKKREPEPSKKKNEEPEPTEKNGSWSRKKNLPAPQPWLVVIMLFQHTSTLLITLFHHLGANSSLFVRLTKMMLGVKTLQSTYFLFCFFRMPAIKKRAKTGRRNARLMIPKISYAQLPLEKQCQIVKVRNMLEAIKRWGICWKRCYIMNANIYLGFFLILSSFLAYSLPAKHWGDAKEAAKGDVKVSAKEFWLTLSFPFRILFRIPFCIPIAPLSQFLNKIGPSFTFFLLTWILPWWSSIYTTCLFPHFLSLVHSVVLSYCNACMILHLLSYLHCFFNPFPTTGIEIDAWRSCHQNHILVHRENKELLLA